MNLPQALQIVKDHIRIGKGMELTNGVPEALEMVVLALEGKRNLVERYGASARVIALYLRKFCDNSLPYDEMIAEASRRASKELEVTQKALELACHDIDNGLIRSHWASNKTAKDYFVQQARKEGN